MAPVNKKQTGATRPRQPGGYVAGRPRPKDPRQGQPADRNPAKPGLGYGAGGRFGRRPGESNYPTMPPRTHDFGPDSIEPWQIDGGVVRPPISDFGGRPPGGDIRFPDLNGEQRGMGYHGLLNGRNGGKGGWRGGGQPPRPHPLPERPERDYFAEFNAFQDPNIAGQQPGPIEQGYGGFQGLDTMTQTKMNNYLNQFAVGGEREKAMNALGYFNEGNPFDPAELRGQGLNRGFRQQGQMGQFSTPGIYQHMSALGSGEGLNQYGGYMGTTTTDQSGQSQYSPLAPKPPNRYGRTRQRLPFMGGGRY